ncbi:hypothetical protein [Alteromonas phage JH01]|nr:hypothetical protein [Alteromonas phage JH01]
MKRLTHIKTIGLFRNLNTGNEYTIKTGVTVKKGEDVLFYIRNGTRQYVSINEFTRLWERV